MIWPCDTSVFCRAADEAIVCVERAGERVDSATDHVRKEEGTQVASFVKSIGSFSTLLLVLSSASTLAQVLHFTGSQVTQRIGSLTNPQGMAIDSGGNIYVADSGKNSISKLTPSGALSAGFLSGDGSPYGVALDAAGNLYITDNLKNDVVKEIPQPGGSYSKAVLPATGLSNPLGVAVDPQGNVYIADSLNNRVVKLTPAGSTYKQSTVLTSPLSLPAAVAVDGAGNLYVGDTSHFRVLKETPSGTGYVESVVANLQSSSPDKPIAMAADGAGDVFILEYFSDLSFAVVKETLSGGAYTQSTLPNSGQNPSGIAADANGSPYIVSPGKNRLVKLLGSQPPDFGPVTVGSGSSTISFIFAFDTNNPWPGQDVLTQGAASLDFTYDDTGTCDNQKTGFFFSPGESCTVDVIFRPQVPGSRYGAVLAMDFVFTDIDATAYAFGTGVGPQISFPPGKQVSSGNDLVEPSGVVVNGFDDIFYADSATGKVYGQSFSNGAWSGTGAFGQTFDHPAGLALDGAANLYVLTPSGVVKFSLVDGSIQNAVVDLTNLAGIAVDHGGNLYLTSSGVGDVHKETLQPDGTYIETAIGYGIASPSGVAVDRSGNVFALNTKDNHLYAETLQPNASYLQSSIALGVAKPSSIAVDANGNLYIADASNGAIDKVTPQPNGSFSESITSYGVIGISSLAVDGWGNIFFSQAPPSGQGQVNAIDVVDPPTLSFTKTTVGVTSAPQYVTVLNAGNAPLAFPLPVSGTNPNIAAGFTLDGESTCPVIVVSGAAGNLDAGSSCVYEIFFMPEVRGSVSGELRLTDTNLNAAAPGYAQQNIALSGSSTTSDTTRTTMRVAPNPVKVGLGVTMTVTVTDTSSSATVPQGGVTFTDSVGGQAVSLNGGAAATLSNGKATITMIPTVAGAHTITAHYGGVDNSFLGSTAEEVLTLQP
jgi:sugar lactone lactonase YvrE